jgi:hypothetical protein
LTETFLRVISSHADQSFETYQPEDNAYVIWRKSALAMLAPVNSMLDTYSLPNHDVPHTAHGNFQMKATARPAFEYQPQQFPSLPV